MKLKKKITRSISQNKQFVLFSLFPFVLLLFMFSCTKRNPYTNPGVEEFYGTYMVRDTKLVEDFILKDSIHFTVYEDLKYSLDFYESANSDDPVDFCNHSGTILDFGTPKASFGPSLIIGDVCNPEAIPKGTFSADFINHGDTIIIQKNITDLNTTKPYDSIFIMKFIK